MCPDLFCSGWSEGVLVELGVGRLEFEVESGERPEEAVSPLLLWP